jgi:hypothetical protein
MIARSRRSFDRVARNRVNLDAWMMQHARRTCMTNNLSVVVRISVDVLHVYGA